MNRRPSTYHESRQFHFAQPPVVHPKPRPGRPASEVSDARRRGEQATRSVVAGLSSRVLWTRWMRKHGNLRLA